MRAAWFSIASVVAPLLALGAALPGCARRAVFENGVFQAGRVSYRVGVPERGWARVEVEDGQVAFVDAALGATLSAHAECTNTGAPLRALTSHAVIGMTERKVSSEKVERLAGRESLRTRLSAKLDGVAQELEIVVVKKDGCHFDFVYSAPPERFALRLPDFRRFVAGFDKLPGRASAR